MRVKLLLPDTITEMPRKKWVLIKPKQEQGKPYEQRTNISMKLINTKGSSKLLKLSLTAKP